jgi:hypothetical protein
MSFVGAAQSAVFTVIVQHKRAAWTIGFDIDFWSIVYGASAKYIRVGQQWLLGIFLTGFLLWVVYGRE